MYVHMLIIGIDPHKASHTAVAIHEHETVLSEMTTLTCRTQTQRLRSWAEEFDEEFGLLSQQTVLAIFLRNSSLLPVNGLLMCRQR
jgi:hypothetical protein